MILFNTGASPKHWAALRREPRNIGALLGVHPSKGGGGMLELIIKLVSAITGLIRAIAELIRIILEA